MSADHTGCQAREARLLAKLNNERAKVALLVDVVVAQHLHIDRLEREQATDQLAILSEADLAWLRAAILSATDLACAQDARGEQL